MIWQSDRPAFARSDDYALAREAFQRAGFDEAGLTSYFSAVDLAEPALVSAARIARMTHANTPRDALVRLFKLGVVVDADSVIQALQPLALEAWIDAGVLRRTTDGVQRVLELTPVRDLLLFHDPDTSATRDQRDDFVMGVGKSSLTLTELMVPGEIDSLLDLGTGCGVIALLHAGHARRVLAVDRNPRAVAIARFNALLNDRRNVECRLSDLYSTLDDERFDRILSNPPFVISPERRFIYRDSGLPLDQLAREVLQQSARHLSANGYCQVLANWVAQGEQADEERLRGWLARTGCDAWVLRSEQRDPADYAAFWLRHTEGLAGEALHARARTWVDYFAAADVRTVSAGAITLRRREAAAHWFRLDPAPEFGLGGGLTIARVFANQSVLEAGDDAVLESRPAAVAAAEMQERRVLHEGAWRVQSVHLALTQGLAFRCEIDQGVASFLERCNGSSTLAQLLDDVAWEGRLDVNALRSDAVLALRRLLALGFVELRCASLDDVQAKLRQESSDIQVTYDQVEYHSGSHPQTHPMRLQAIAYLRGMQPAPVARCRVLELGCGNGANLIPLALSMPDAQFCGIDLSVKAIDKARSDAQGMELNNLTLIQADLLEVAASAGGIALGSFDYIIAHGLYSWVPERVRYRILWLIKRLLRPQGIAFVSYNANPGGHLRTMLRDMLLFHLRNIADPRQRIVEAREFAKFLASGTPENSNNHFRIFMRAEAARLERSSDALIFHDDLETNNRFLNFHEFVAQAAVHGLQYLSEAEYFETQALMLPAAAQRAVQGLAAEPMLREQYLDFLKCRRFRQTLLCHAEVQLSTGLRLDRIPAMLLSSMAKRTVQPGGETDYDAPSGAKIGTRNPMTVAAMDLMIDSRPRFASFNEVLATGCRASGIDIETDAMQREEEQRSLVDFVAQGFALGMLELSMWQPPAPERIGERPQALPLALRQIQLDTHVSNILGEVISLDVAGQALLRLCDGQRTRSELTAVMLEAFRSGRLVFKNADGDVMSADEHLVRAQIDKNLEGLARCGLFQA